MSFETEGKIRLPGTYVDTGAVEHAYARTTYGLQGATLESAFYHPTDTSSFEEGYVALTRARRSTEIFLVEGALEEDEAHGTVAELTDTDTVVEALARRGAGRLAHAEDPSPGTGIQPAGVSLGELAARGEALDAVLASAPPPVDLALAAAERRLQSLRLRQRRDGPLNPSKSGGRDTTSWIDAAIQRTEEEVASLRTLLREREVWLVNHTPELEERKAVLHAAAARRVQLVHMLCAKPPAAVMKSLGPRPRRPAAARRWDAAAVGVITGLDVTTTAFVDPQDRSRPERTAAVPAEQLPDVR